MIVKGQVKSGVWFTVKYLLLFFVQFQAVTLHTDFGDIKLELFCDKIPNSCEVSNLYLFFYSQFVQTNAYFCNITLLFYVFYYRTSWHCVLVDTMMVVCYIEI